MRAQASSQDDAHDAHASAPNATSATSATNATNAANAPNATNAGRNPAATNAIATANAAPDAAPARPVSETRAHAPTANALTGDAPVDRQRAVASAVNQGVMHGAANGRVVVGELGAVHVDARSVAGAVAVDVRTEHADAAVSLKITRAARCSKPREAATRPVWKVDVKHDASKFDGDPRGRNARDERRSSDDEDDDALTPAPKKGQARFVL